METNFVIKEDGLVPYIYMEIVSTSASMSSPLISNFKSFINLIDDDILSEYSGILKNKIPDYISMLSQEDFKVNGPIYISGIMDIIETIDTYLNNKENNV